jgi:hypothetical protein
MEVCVCSSPILLHLPFFHCTPNTLDGPCSFPPQDLCTGCALCREHWPTFLILQIAVEISLVFPKNPPTGYSMLSGLQQVTCVTCLFALDYMGTFIVGFLT